MGGIATDGAGVDVQTCGECADGVGAAGLQDLEQGQHPCGGSGHRKSIAPIPGGFCPVFDLAFEVMTTNTPASRPANLVSIRIISDDVARLAEFYAQVTGTAVRWLTPDFVELPTPAGTLAIGSTRTVALFGPGRHAPPTTTPRSSSSSSTTSTASASDPASTCPSTSSTSRRQCRGATDPCCFVIPTATWSTSSHR